jgi:hypothetical protein
MVARILNLIVSSHIAFLIGLVNIIHAGPWDMESALLITYSMIYFAAAVALFRSHLWAWILSLLSIGAALFWSTQTSVRHLHMLPFSGDGGGFPFLITSGASILFSILLFIVAREWRSCGLDKAQPLRRANRRQPPRPL